MLFFNASWSEECKLMSDIIGELGKDAKVQSQARFLVIEAEDHEDVTIKYEVDAVPSFVFIKNKETLNKLSGADPAEFRKKLSQFAQAPIQTTSTATSGNKEEVNFDST